MNQSKTPKILVLIGKTTKTGTPTGGKRRLACRMWIGLNRRLPTSRVSQMRVAEEAGSDFGWHGMWGRVMLLMMMMTKDLEV